MVTMAAADGALGDLHYFGGESFHVDPPAEARSFASIKQASLRNNKRPTSRMPILVYLFQGKKIQPEVIPDLKSGTPWNSDCPT